MGKYKRIFIIVADSLGVGSCPDSYLYGDVGANTFQHLSYSEENFNIPNLMKLGIGMIDDINNTPPVKKPLACYGKAKPMSLGKDTLTGHFEIMGLHVTRKFPSFTENGFPTELITALEKETGHRFIGNYAASGTEIIKEWGERHMQTGEIIIYTSADSVLQLAAHEEIIPLPELDRICRIARRLTLANPKWMVGRIIARPFIGRNRNDFIRTANRHDYAVKPFGKTVLDQLKENGYDVIAVGKINDIFAGEGITSFVKTKSNDDGMTKTINIVKEKDFTGLCFVNLVDFDALYGHRRDPRGYARCVEAFDARLGEMLPLLKDDDLLIICADHGNDPTHHGTDHTREYIPILIYNAGREAFDLGIRSTFADIGATVAANFGLTGTGIGSDLLKQ